MSPDELLETVVVLNTEQLLQFITERENDLRLCFLQALPGSATNKYFEKIFSALAQKRHTEDEVNSDQLQLLYTHLAFYFKRINKWQFVDACTTHIQNNIFRRRLSAWLHYKRYNTYVSHLNEYSSYLAKLSQAIADDVEDYTFEILGDLHEYHTSGIERLPEDYRDRIGEFLNDDDLKIQFPILGQYGDYQIGLLPDIRVTIANDKIHTPSPRAQNIFKEKFIDYVQRNNLFGYTIQQAADEVIGKGQADFDEGYEKLTPEQVVKIYCYCNMRMHYFSSISLFERSDLVNQFYQTNGRIKFIDIGCGPGTSGLAFAEHIYTTTGLPSVFDYFGIDTSNVMKQQAQDMMVNSVFVNPSTTNFFSDITQVSSNYLDNASCIIVNTCYVFASQHLDLDRLAEYLNNLNKKFPYIPKYLLFQNPNNDYVNRRYFEFRELLDQKEVIYSQKEKIFYYNQPKQYGEPKNRIVFFEILKF